MTFLFLTGQDTSAAERGPSWEAKAQDPIWVHLLYHLHSRFRPGPWLLNAWAAGFSNSITPWFGTLYQRSPTSLTLQNGWIKAAQNAPNPCCLEDQEGWFKHWSRKASLINHYLNREVRKWIRQLSEERRFQAEKTVSRMALKQEHIWSVLETYRMRERKLRDGRRQMGERGGIKIR